MRGSCNLIMIIVNLMYLVNSSCKQLQSSRVFKSTHTTFEKSCSKAKALAKKAPWDSGTDPLTGADWCRAGNSPDNLTIGWQTFGGG